MISSSACNGCTACRYACPAGAISISDDANGFPRAAVDNEKCVSCGACDSVCCCSDSDGAFTTCLYTCSAYNEDTKIRLGSSSGGIFGALAQNVLRQGGVVYGAAFDASNVVRHIMIDKEADLPRLLGSKYVQSALGTAFGDIADLLRTGRRVLFSGTPCQVAGLKKHLNFENPNLITVDVICHGVTSRSAWRDYLQRLSGKRKKMVSHISFRDKETGWHRFSFSYRLNNRKHICLFADDPFCYLFDKHYTLRPECFHCPHARNIHSSELTLGDFWGVEKFKECHDDNLGTSIILVHAEKGREILQSCAGLNLVQIRTEDALRDNLHEPPKQPDGYDAFWACYHTSGLDACIKRYFYGTGLRRMKIAIKSILIKLRLIKYFI